MYPEPAGRHHRTHFHARYGEHKAVYWLAPTETRLEEHYPPHPD
jgi:hypothetical protein